MSDTLCNLPRDIWATIFSFLDLTSYLRASRWSKSFKQITEEYNKRETINLSECRRRIDEALPSLLRTHRTCTKIYADNCYTLSNKNLYDLCSHYSETLKYLDLRRLTSFDPLSKLKVIEYLNLSECSNAELKTGQFVTSLPLTLTRLYLDGLLLLNNAILMSILQRCTNLDFLSLEQCSISNDAVKAISESCPNLASLKLSWCSNITSNGFSILSSCKKLRVLEVEECYNFNDIALIPIAKNCPQLEKLHLENCFRITDSGMQAINNNLKNLLFLNIVGCQINEQLINDFKARNLQCVVKQ